MRSQPATRFGRWCGVAPPGLDLVVILHACPAMIPVPVPVSFNHAREFHPDDVIDGRYRIVRRLAEGGMGTVFLAEHLLIRRRVAIKLLHAELATDRAMVGRFLNEASIAGTMSHPHIIEATDMGFTRDAVPYIVFEYLEGWLLTEEIRRLGTLPLRRALVIARQIASALEAVHAAQIAHLDLKSDNVFLTSRGDVPDHAKLIDFGISRFVADDTEPTRLGILMGTPEFMAPEQILNPDDADCRADIYALGVLLYEMLAGRCPFECEDPRTVLYRTLHETPPPLGRPIPPALDQLLFDGLLVKTRDRRLQSMTELIAILDALISRARSQVPQALATFDAAAGDGSGPLASSLWTADGTPGREAPPRSAPSWR